MSTIIIIALVDNFAVTAVRGNSYIIINWGTSHPVLRQETRSIQVVVSSECPTGIQPIQTQVYNVMARQQNSINASRLGNYCS